MLDDDIKKKLSDKRGVLKSRFDLILTPDEIDYIMSKYSLVSDVKYAVRLFFDGGYRYCSVCNNVLLTNDNKTTCSNVCRKSLRESNCLKKYGVTHESKSNVIKDKLKKSNLEKYGVEYTITLDSVKEKIKQTNLEKYGTENAMQSNVVKDKLKNAIYEKYGVHSTLLLDTVREKIKQTNLDRYGVDNNFKSKDFRNYIKSVIMEKYGVENVSQLGDIKEKIKQTNLDRYGVENTFKLYNPKNYNLYLKYKDKILYDSNTIISYDDFINLKITNNDKYVYSTEYLLSQINKTVNPSILLNQFSTSSFFDNIRFYDIDYNINIGSSKEYELCSYLDSLNIKYIKNSRNIIKPLELDIYIPEYNLAIEYNGDYWHSSKFKDKNYHQNKTKLCNEKGITLIHIYEHLYNKNPSIYHSIIKAKLGLNERVYARKCVLKIVDKVQEKEFLDNYHLQGYTPSKICYGLYFGKKLVTICSFKKSRFDKNHEYELLRNCTLPNITVVGGLSKLIKHFKDKYNQSDVVCYSDASISFNKGGSLTTPNYVWIKGDLVYKRYQTMKHLLPKLLQDKYNNSLTEKENMINNGFMQIFDAGNYKTIL